MRTKIQILNTYQRIRANIKSPTWNLIGLACSSFLLLPTRTRPSFLGGVSIPQIGARRRRCKHGEVYLRGYLSVDVHIFIIERPNSMLTCNAS